MRTARRTELGITILELVVAISVLAVLGSGILFALSRAIVANRESRLDLIAMGEVNKQIDLLRVNSKLTSWPHSTLDCAGAFPCTKTFSVPTGILTTELPAGASGSYEIDQPSWGNVDILSVEITVSYSIQGRSKSVISTTYIAKQGLNRS